MVLLTTTQAMLRAIQHLKDIEAKGTEKDVSLDPSLVSLQLHDPISHDAVLDLSKTIRQLKASSVSDADKLNISSLDLEDLLRGSRVYIAPQKPKTEPTSEYKALMARLRQEEEARAYELMRRPRPANESFAQRFPNSPHAHLFPASKEDIGDEDEVTYSDINRQLAVIVNILVSIIACGVAIWVVARHWSLPSRLGLSMGGGGTIGAAEVVVYAGYLRRVKEAKAKAAKEREVKEVVDTWVIHGRATEKQSLPASESWMPDQPNLRRRKWLSDQDD